MKIYNMNRFKNNNNYDNDNNNLTSYQNDK
jgi:hypothetical protein